MISNLGKDVSSITYARRTYDTRTQTGPVGYGISQTPAARSTGTAHTRSLESAHPSRILISVVRSDLDVPNITSFPSSNNDVFLAPPNGRSRSNRSILVFARHRTSTGAPMDHRTHHRRVGRSASSVDRGPRPRWERRLGPEVGVGVQDGP